MGGASTAQYSCASTCAASVPSTLSNQSAKRVSGAVSTMSGSTLSNTPTAPCIGG
ncbi:hypothetical protein D3C87_1099390 [compost metagenome]